MPEAKLRPSIGIDVGGTSIKMGVCVADQVVMTIDPLPTEEYEGADALTSAIAQQVGILRENFPEIETFGVGVPGLVDFNKGVVRNLTNVPGWNQYPLRDALAKKTGLSGIIDNDANAMTYGEFKYGAAKGYQHVVAMTLGTGIGGGLIINGDLFRGANFIAGELGQTSIDYDGNSGEYGNFGAAEKYVGNNQIAAHAKALYAKNGITKSLEECTPKALDEASCQGDEIAVQAWEDIAKWLGTMVSSIIWVLDPEAIIIGGGVSKAGDVLFHPLKKRLQATLSETLWNQLNLIPARFGNDAGMIGCAALALDSRNS